MQRLISDDIRNMNSLIEEQQIGKRRFSGEIRFSSAPDIISRKDTGEYGSDFSRRLESAKAELNRNEKTGDKRGLRRSKGGFSRRDSKQHALYKQPKIIDFPAIGDEKPHVKKDAYSHPQRPVSGINGIDALFIIAFAIFLALASQFFISPGGMNRLFINSETMTLRQDVYSGAFIRQEAVEDISAEVELQDIDPAQFAALEVVNYSVQPGDTLSQIALDQNLNMDTLISFNQIQDVRRMQVGQELLIPNRNGLLHLVESGDSLAGLADEYGSSLNAILDANSLTSEQILPGQTIFIPGARMDSLDLRLVLGELFIYPTVGRYTSGFGYRPDPFTGVNRFHNGLDLANRTGTAIRAAMGGTVVRVETQIGNYGKFIIIQHPRGYQTLYAHLSSINVSNGQYVSQNELIGLMGNTGRSTGSHLHFSIILNGDFVDPLTYLH